MALSKIILSSPKSSCEKVTRKQSISIVSSCDIGSSDGGINSEEKSIGDPVELKSYQLSKGTISKGSDTFVKVPKSSSSSIEKNDSFLYHVTFDPKNPNNHTTNVIVVNPA